MQFYHTVHSWSNYICMLCWNDLFIPYAHIGSDQFATTSGNNKLCLWISLFCNTSEGPSIHAKKIKSIMNYSVNSWPAFELSLTEIYLLKIEVWKLCIPSSQQKFKCVFSYYAVIILWEILYAHYIICSSVCTCSSVRSGGYHSSWPSAGEGVFVIAALPNLRCDK